MSIKLGGVLRLALLAGGLLFALWIGIRGAGQPAKVWAQDNVGTYTVVEGDTLSGIAERFGVSVEALTEINHIADPTLIQVGQVLVIPAANAALGSVSTALVQANPGDTLLSIAQRYTQEISLLTTLNQISPTVRLFPGQSVRLPAESAPRLPLNFGAVKVINSPTQLAQGRTGRLWVETSRPLSLTANWNGLLITLTRPLTQPNLSFAWLPVPALLDPGIYTLSLSYLAANGFPLVHVQSLAVQEGGYEFQEIELPPDRAALLDPTLITSETQKVATVWNLVTAGPWWSGAFVRPISDEYPTTSPFGTRRTYNGGALAGYHAGQDFGVPPGITVTAPAAGIVALAEPLQVRGNAVIIDHGHGLLSGYWHLSQILVQVGQPIQVGDVIGLVGNTGLSTGAHLHWEVHIYGIAVDPMQFVAEPLIDRQK